MFKLPPKPPRPAIPAIAFGLIAAMLCSGDTALPGGLGCNRSRRRGGFGPLPCRWFGAIFEDIERRWLNHVRRLPGQHLELRLLVCICVQAHLVR